MRPIMLSILFVYFLTVFSCAERANSTSSGEKQGVVEGAQNFSSYLSLLEGKNVGIVSNQTSMIGNTHLVDTLISLGIKVEIVFAPEHGFRGNAEAGETINDFVDAKTGISIISLYGNKYKPTVESLTGLDMLVFDIQDVGVRFFTYLSTLHYVMEACAENDVPLLVLDRPNPNAWYIDGPIMEKEHTSFIGLHPVPIVYGMTIGEYAKMINGEGWLKGGIQCELNIVPCKNYSHVTHYDLPVIPSPNLPSMRSVYLYPSIALFEGTVLNEGRGTLTPFEVFGHPDFQGGNYKYTPKSIKGMSNNPKLKDQECFGMNLRDMSIDYLRKKKGLQLEWLILAFDSTKTEKFFIPFFENLAGTDKLRGQITNKVGIEEIRSSWEEELQEFKKIREKYLIYP